MNPSRRKQDRDESLLNALVAVGDVVQLQGLVNAHAPELSSELLEALDRLAPAGPIAGSFGDRRAAVFDALVLGLARNNVRELIPRLARYARDTPLNSLVVEAFATLGPMEAVAVCRRALRSEDQYVRAAVASGAVACAAGGWGDQEFVRACFDMLWAIAMDKTAPRVAQLADALLALHRDRAAALLMDPMVLSPEHPRFLDVLSALTHARAEVPPQRVEALLGEVEPRASEYPFSRCYSALLELLGRSAPSKARPRLDRALGSTDARVRRDAVESLLAMDGMVPIYRNYSREEYAHWPYPAQVVADLADLMLQVESNGLNGVFVNASPLWWRVAAERLRTVEAFASEGVLSELALHLGLADPTLTERDVRDWRWPDSAEVHAKRLDAAWAADPDRREVCILLYMRMNRTCFVRSLDDR